MKNLFRLVMDQAGPLVGPNVFPLERARHAGALLDELGAATRQIADIRRRALTDLHADGMSYSQIATALGLSKTAVAKHLSGG
jgi:DNA-directed RNA polymerase specialized sigma24 family protein